MLRSVYSVVLLVMSKFWDLILGDGEGGGGRGVAFPEMLCGRRKIMHAPNVIRERK